MWIILPFVHLIDVKACRGKIVKPVAVECNTDVLHMCIESKGEGSHRISNGKMDDVSEKKVQSPKCVYKGTWP